jgi:hypothetical protein
LGTPPLVENRAMNFSTVPVVRNLREVPSDPDLVEMELGNEETVEAVRAWLAEIGPGGPIRL